MDSHNSIFNREKLLKHSCSTCPALHSVSHTTAICDHPKSTKLKIKDPYSESCRWHDRSYIDRG